MRPATKEGLESVVARIHSLLERSAFLEKGEHGRSARARLSQQDRDRIVTNVLTRLSRDSD
jgi:hypothetical protein